MPNTEGQNIELMAIIATLTSWLDRGIPDQGLVRIWRPEEGDVIDVSAGLNVSDVFSYLDDWRKEISVRSLD